MMLLESLTIPKIRRRETLKLNEKNEKEIKNIIRRIGNILSDEMPAPQKVPACLKCAYYELCFV